MRKALLPMVACLALCGGATAALIVTTAHAQPEPRKPMMVAQAAPAPGAPAGAPHRMSMGPGMDRPMPTPAEMAAHFKQMCQDHYAHQAAELAYTEAKLSLTPSEQSLFGRWKEVKLDTAKRRAGACATHEPSERSARTMPSVVDHMAREEEMLKRRLADLDAERPALEALFNALSPEQKREFGRSQHGGMMGHRMFAGGPGMMGHHMMGQGMMGPGMEHGMMHRGPRDMGPPGGPPEGPGDSPPGPPPQ
jgi:LTXXQ motif family protein